MFVVTLYVFHPLYLEFDHFSILTITMDSQSPPIKVRDESCQSKMARMPLHNLFYNRIKKTIDFHFKFPLPQRDDVESKIY